jgi:hypothetical protein
MDNYCTLSSSVLVKVMVIGPVEREGEVLTHSDAFLLTFLASANDLLEMVVNYEPKHKIKMAQPFYASSYFKTANHTMGHSHLTDVTHLMTSGDLGGFITPS